MLNESGKLAGVDDRGQLVESNSLRSIAGPTMGAPLKTFQRMDRRLYGRHPSGALPKARKAHDDLRAPFRAQADALRAGRSHRASPSISASRRSRTATLKRA